jgi:hypothetical protein
MPKSFLRNFEHQGDYTVPHTIIAIIWTGLDERNKTLWRQVDEYEKHIKEIMRCKTQNQ